MDYQSKTPQAENSVAKNRKTAELANNKQIYCLRKDINLLIFAIVQLEKAVCNWIGDNK